MPYAGGKVRITDAAPNEWTTWNPTYTNITVGNGTVTAAYMQTSSLVICRFRLVWGSTTSFSSTPLVDLPVAAHADYGFHDAFGSAFMYDDNAGTRNGGTVVYYADSQVFFVSDETSGGATVTSSVPFTWATSDILSFRATYQAA